MAELDPAAARQSETWSLGDYFSLGSRLTIVGELLCEAADVRSGWAVLDVATGPGSTALAAARRGCRVTGIDISERLLGIAAARARSENLAIAFHRADAEDMPFEDATFDAVTSSFGVSFAASPRRAADEIVRVCRAGGIIALANWAPTGANAVENDVIARYVDGDDPPGPWSTESGLESLFGSRVDSLAVSERTLVFRFSSVADYVDTALEQFGPFIRLAESLSSDQRTSLRNDLIEGLNAVNESGDETMVVPFPYLEVVARRR